MTDLDGRAMALKQLLVVILRAMVMTSLPGNSDVYSAHGQ